MISHLHELFAWTFKEESSIAADGERVGQLPKLKQDQLKCLNETLLPDLVRSLPSEFWQSEQWTTFHLNGLPLEWAVRRYARDKSRSNQDTLVSYLRKFSIGYLIWFLSQTIKEGHKGISLEIMDLVLGIQKEYFETHSNVEEKDKFEFHDIRAFEKFTAQLVAGTIVEPELMPKLRLYLSNEWDFIKSNHLDPNGTFAKKKTEVEAYLDKRDRQELPTKHRKDSHSAP